MERVISICGPTASGKSDLSDDIADLLSDRSGTLVPTILVDSMQVYKEIPIISNQARRRSAELMGIISVDEEWNVAKHRKESDRILQGCSSKFCVLDAGTGMYLNAILMDIQLAPKVDTRTRQAAEGIVAVHNSTGNARREGRRMELEISGAAPRGSVWDARLRFNTYLIYIRPPKDELAKSIERRTRRIMDFAEPEIQTLRTMSEEGTQITPQVKSAIGIREIEAYLAGKTTFEEATSGITSRTRALAKRQLTWFEKLVKTLNKKPDVRVVEIANAAEFDHSMLGADS